METQVEPRKKNIKSRFSMSLRSLRQRISTAGSRRSRPAVPAKDDEHPFQVPVIQYEPDGTLTVIHENKYKHKKHDKLSLVVDVEEAPSSPTSITSTPTTPKSDIPSTYYKPLPPLPAASASRTSKFPPIHIPPYTGPDRLTLLPPELINEILFYMREADQQCLRASCSRFFRILPETHAVENYAIRSDKLPAYLWLDPDEQVEFARRIFRDLPVSRREGKKVCVGCRKIVRVKVFGKERSCRQCTERWWNYV